LAPLARLCLTGPESTGKSELAGQLARATGWPVIDEYAREYAERVNRELTAADVEPIARGEIANLDRAVPPVILDTDLLSTVVYARHYYGSCPQWIVEEARRRRADLYLLMDTDLPFEGDAVRDTSTDREDLFDAFRRALDEFETNWTIVSGPREERRQRSLALLRSL
jgi:nicotinamide riboside kinase